MNILPVNKSKKAGSRTENGLLFIPDISGFTDLVRSTDQVTGQQITYELLSTIIGHAGSNLQIAEIEGDAVFFYKWKMAPSVDELYGRFKRMKRAFDDKILELQDRYGLELKLQLKAIAHYGEMTEFPIGGFRKLYGKVVVEAHRLLKNNIPGHSYLLITDQLMAAANHRTVNNTLREIHASKLCEGYSGLNFLCFTYILFETIQFSA